MTFSFVKNVENHSSFISGIMGSAESICRYSSFLASSVLCIYL